MCSFAQLLVKPLLRTCPYLPWCVLHTLPNPLQVIEVVCCKMSELQSDLYCHFLQSNITRHLLNADGKKSAKVPSLLHSSAIAIALALVERTSCDHHAACSWLEGSLCPCFACGARLV